MDIIVEGKANKFFKPDEIILDIKFYTKSTSYEDAMKNGVENVGEFIANIIEKLDFKKEDLKTRSFKVAEISRYDSEKKISIKEGFQYSQSAKLKLDFNREHMSKFMEEVSKLKNPPMYQIYFGVKNEQKAKAIVIAEAYAKAEEKAKMIALAAGKKLKDCIKVDFRPFEEAVISNSNLRGGGMMEMEKSRVVGTTAQVIQKVFTPEDVEIQETLYCMWITE